MQKVKSKKPTKTNSSASSGSNEKKMEEGQHLKVPLDPKHMLKMHISQAIMKHLCLVK